MALLAPLAPLTRTGKMGQITWTLSPHHCRIDGKSFEAPDVVENSISGFPDVLNKTRCSSSVVSKGDV